MNLKIIKQHYWLLTGLILLGALLLRIVGLDQFPPSLYWEEAALGFDAYSILKTGRDHHGNLLPIVAFESFGDWKPSLYFYAIVPFIKLVGLNLWAVRLPAVVSGVMIVLGLGELAKRIKDERLALIAMAVTAISPWAIQFSRAGWEVNLATALILWGVVLFFKGKKWVIAGAILLALSMYAYHAARLVAPLLGVILAGWWLVFSQEDGGQKKIIISAKLSWANFKFLALAAGVALIISLPLLKAMGSPQLTQRFAETSVFSNLGLIEKSNQLRAEAGNTILARIIYHRYLIFGKQILSSALTHFHGSFLFIAGDNNPRHSIQYFGHLYHLEFVLLVLGIFALFKKWRSEHFVLLAWAVIGVLPAALTNAVPHALRILPMMPVFLLVISMGILWLWETIKQPVVKKVVMVLLMGGYLLELSILWRFYSQVYPKLYSQEWQYGYQQMVLEVNRYQEEYPDLPVFITREYGRPAMFYWFFSQTDPRRVQAAAPTSSRDQSELTSFENMKFINSTNSVESDQAILVSSPGFAENLTGLGYALSNVSSPIENLRGETVWQVQVVNK